MIQMNSRILGSVREVQDVREALGLGRQVYCVAVRSFFLCAYAGLFEWRFGDWTNVMLNGFRVASTTRRGVAIVINCQRRLQWYEVKHHCIPWNMT
jgi:hypothetical protein